MLVPALQPHQQHQSPFQLHFYGFQRVVNRARNYLNNVGPTVPNVYNLPDVRFDEGAALWVEKSPPIKGGGFYEIRPTESKMKLLGVALESAFQGMESTLTIPDRLNTMFNNDNFTVWHLTELRYDSGYDGVPVNFMCMMMACEGDLVLTQLVWKIGLAFVWKALQQYHNRGGLVPDGAYEDARKIAIERAGLEEQLERAGTVGEHTELLHKIQKLLAAERKALEGSVA